MQVRVLMYHDVVRAPDVASSGFGGADADSYKVEPARFIEHLMTLSRVLSRPIVRATDVFGQSPPDRARVKLQLGPAPLMLTFDDGGASAPKIADIIERFGWHGHFFVVTDLIGRRTFLSAPEIRELDARGHVIGSHSASHPERITSLSQRMAVGEWQRSVDALQQLLGHEVTTASIPGGFYSEAIAWAAAAARIRVLFTSEPTSIVSRVGPCQILGRYTIRRETSAGQVRAYATGQPVACASQWLSWNLKKAAKQVAGPAYVRARTVFFGARPGTATVRPAS